MSMILRSFALLSSTAALAGFASAQCLMPTGVAQALIPDSTFPPNDEGATAEMALGFTFPIAGAALAPTHFVAHSNGTIYLTDGAGIVGQAVYGVDSLNEFRGVAGDSPRIVVKGGDNAGYLPTSEVRIDTSVAGEVKISYVDWSQFTSGLPNAWSCSVTLFASGEVRMDFGDGFDHTVEDFCGISAGNGIGTGLEFSSDLSAGGNSGALALVYEANWTSFDLQHSSVTFTPNGTGYDFARTCQQPPASHTSYGVGCYDGSTFASAYQHFANASAVETALEGTALSFVPNGPGYVIDVSPATYMAPTGGETQVFMGDDSDLTITPSVPFQFLGTTPVADLHVHSNAFVSMGPGNSNFAYGDVFSFNAGTSPSFRTNMDLNPPAGGRIVYEEIAGVLYLTYENTLRWGQFGAGETIQYQFVLATGEVAVVFQQLTGVATSAAIVGYSPGGHLDNPIDFATDLPYSCSVDGINAPMTLSATPEPISTASTGTTVSYVIDDIPDATGSSGVHFGTVILSFTGSPGVDLGFLGAPGCSAYIGSLDLLLSFVGIGSTSNVVDVVYPAGIPPGTQLFAQAASVTTAGLLNAIGITTSNGIESYFETF